MNDDDGEAVAEFIRTKGITGTRPPAFCRPKHCLLPLTGLPWKNMRSRVIGGTGHERLLAGEN